MLKVICILLLSISITQAAVPITRNGKAEAEIIIAADAHPAVKYAAEELRHWTEAISGAKLPVIHAPGGAATRIILSVNNDLAELRDNDGYAVRTQGREIHLIASCPKGILNGVYRLLFKNTDIIWARPNEDFGTIYSRKSDLDFGQTNYIDIPVYRLRGWQISGEASNIWQARQGSNWASAWMKKDPRNLRFAPILEYGGGHNLIGRYIQEKKYFNSHPEYYSMLDGKHQRPSESRNSSQLCFTNPELLKTFIKELDERIKADPDYITYRIMIEDNWKVCECPECLKPITIDGKSIDNKNKAFRSTQFFLWLNQIARHMRKHYPGKRILTFAYFFTEPPPQCPVEPNIDISFCPIAKNSKFNIEAPENAVTMEKFSNWMKVTPNLTWREYYGLVGPFPRPTDIIALADWKYVNSYGVTRTYSEMYGDIDTPRQKHTKSWDANAMYFWVMANGCWNPAQDVRALRREFLTRVYGPAADDVAEYYRLIEDQWFKTPGKSTYADRSWQNWRKCVIEPGLEQPCRAALERAVAKVVHPNGRKMLAAVRANFEEFMKYQEQFQIQAVRVEKAPQLDPDFNSGEWRKATSVDQFFVGNNQILYQNPTELRVLYDDQNIYFGVKCHHPDVPKMQYRPASQEKNQAPDGEGFEIFLSGIWKGEPHFTQLSFDPVNNRRTAVRSAQWNSVVEITYDGWSGMATVPWKSIGMKPGETKELRGAFVRQFERPPRPGVAPIRSAQLFGAQRHKPKTFIPINFN